MGTRSGDRELSKLTSSQRSVIKRSLRAAKEQSEDALREASEKYQQMYGISPKTLQALVDECAVNALPSVQRQTKDPTPTPCSVPTSPKAQPTRPTGNKTASHKLTPDQITRLCAQFRIAYVAPGDALTRFYNKYESIYGVSRKELKAAINVDRRNHPAAYVRLKEKRLAQERQTRKIKRGTATTHTETALPVSGRHPLIISESVLTNIAERLAPRHGTNQEVARIREQLRAFTESPRSRHGYLAWRFHEQTTRPGSTRTESVRELLTTMSVIVEQDKGLIVNLQNDHGDVLGDNPEIARGALDAEFRKTHAGEAWTSGPRAIVRSRASSEFLRRAVVLTFGSQDFYHHLSPMLKRLQPPTRSECVSLRLSSNAMSSIYNLRLMLTQVDEFFASMNARGGQTYETGLAQLRALSNGAFDFVLGAASPTVRLPPAVPLPVVILPPGELIHPFVTNMRKSGRFRGGDIDEGRLQVLTQLWTHLSEYGTCTMYEGAFPANGKDNGYLILAISYEGYGEDAVAISPWRGEHATFVVRADVGKRRSWGTVLASTKEEAKQLGARRLVFKANHDHGIDEYEAMFQKIVALFVCDPEEFEDGAIYFDADEGRYEVRPP